MHSEYLLNLRNTLTANYDLIIHEIIPAKRGFFGETWKLETDRADYFLKLDYWDYHKGIYEKSLPVIEAVTNSGISFIPKVIKTNKDGFSFEMDGGIGAVFEFVKGENTEDYKVGRLFEKLAKIYQLDLQNMSIEEERFDTAVLEEFESLKREAARDTAFTDQIEERFSRKEEKIFHFAERLKRFSAICIGDTGHFHLTHGDAGGNCILNGEEFSIIDWDYPKYAPIERDAWFFMCKEENLTAINAILLTNRLDYKLNMNRICYFCYYSYFYYLTEYLKAFLFLEQTEKKQDMLNSIAEYLGSSWIYEQLEAAEKYDKG